MNAQPDVERVPLSSGRRPAIVKEPPDQPAISHQPVIKATSMHLFHRSPPSLRPLWEPVHHPCRAPVLTSCMPQQPGMHLSVTPGGWQILVIVPPSEVYEHSTRLSAGRKIIPMRAPARGHCLVSLAWHSRVIMLLMREREREIRG